jgi:tetratricopeptide (TPR) repeat protein
VLSWVRAQEAYGYYYSDDLASAIDVARHAQFVAGTSASVGFALAAALEARALSSMGAERKTEAEAAFRRAESALAVLEADEMAASAFGYNEAQLRFHEGSLYTHLGDTDSAWRAQQRALEIIPAADYTDRVLTCLDRAICLAQIGDGRAAISYAAGVLSPLTEDQRAGIISGRALGVITALPTAQRASPEARDFPDLLVLPRSESSQ